MASRKGLRVRSHQRVNNNDKNFHFIQLTLEQHGFELHGSTYMQIFFNSKCCVTRPAVG